MSFSYRPGLKVAEFHFTTKSQKRSRPPLGTRRGAPDAHDALPPRLPKNIPKKTRHVVGGASSELLRRWARPRCPLTAPWKGNTGSDDVQGCGVGGAGGTPGKLKLQLASCHAGHDGHAGFYRGCAHGRTAQEAARSPPPNPAHADDASPLGVSATHSKISKK